MFIRSRILLLTFILLATPGLAQSWPQWGQNSRHSGSLPTAGPRLSRNIADIIYDPLVPQMLASTGGNLLAHYAFQIQALGAAYTPASLGGDGKIYSQNSGHLFVVAGFPRARAARRR